MTEPAGPALHMVFLRRHLAPSVAGAVVITAAPLARESGRLGLEERAPDP